MIVSASHRDSSRDRKLVLMWERRQASWEHLLPAKRMWDLAVASVFGLLLAFIVSAPQFGGGRSRTFGRSRPAGQRGSLATSSRFPSPCYRWHLRP